MIDSLSSLKDNQGRKLKKDLKVMIGGVASYPKRVDQLFKSDQQYLESWKLAVRNFAYKEFGSSLVSMVYHSDEGYPHIHFFVIPNFENGEKMADLHPGMKARALCKKGKNAKAAAVAVGLAQFQDDYYHCVSQFFGHARISDKPKARQRYAFWQAYKSMKSQFHKLTKQIRSIELWTDITDVKKRDAKGKDWMR